MQVAVYAIGGTARTLHVARAMMDGLARHGTPASLHQRWTGNVAADVAIAYGWNHEPVFTAYRAAGRHFVYWDMGYWDRRPEGNKKDGFHRLAVDSWDTADTMRHCMPGDRFATSGIQLQPWGSKGEGIILAGMSGKAAGTHGFLSGEWERKTITWLQAVTRRPVIVRAKPTGDQSKVEPIASVLARSHMLITHHSNAAMDAMIAGVPFYAKKGVGKIFSPDTLMIDDYPAIEDEKRLQLLQDIAYAQWRPSEMRTGQAWEHIRCILRST